jgi:hypothetical protein
MNKTVYRAGENCFLQREELSDGSEVFNVNLHTNNEMRISFNCTDLEHAKRLHIEIEACNEAEISDHFENLQEQLDYERTRSKSKIDNLQEQIAQADEVNDVLRAKHKAVIDSIYALWQKNQLKLDSLNRAIKGLDESITVRDAIIKDRDERIDKLIASVGRLSATSESALFQEGKLRKEFDLAIKIHDAKIVEKDRQIKELDNQIGQLIGRKSVNADQIDEEIDENKELKKCRDKLSKVAGHLGTARAEIRNLTKERDQLKEWQKAQKNIGVTVEK